MNPVRLTDVTLRDGLQMEARYLGNDEKLGLLERLLACGHSRVELTSFVPAKWVPQFVGHQEFCQRAFAELPPLKSQETMAFVPNLKGLERLIAFPIPWASTFIATSEEFNRRNVNQSVAETATELGQIVEQAHRHGRKVRIYISTVFGCPYQGAISEARLDEVFAIVARLKPDEIALSDTIGVALPTQVSAVVKRFARHFPLEKTALHLHDTYSLALAGAEAGFNEGIRLFDGSTGGVGGCPYAKGATGNVPIESLAYLFFRQGRLPEFKWARIEETLSFLETHGLELHSSLHNILKKGGAVYGIH